MAVDKISSDTERRQAELLGAISQPASLYFASAPTLNKPASDTISKAVTNISTTYGPRSVPELDLPEDADSDLVDRGRRGLKELVEGDEGFIDDLVHALFLITQESSTERLATTRDLLNAERAYSNAIEKERSDEIQKQIALS